MRWMAVQIRPTSGPVSLGTLKAWAQEVSMLGLLALNLGFREEEEVEWVSGLSRGRD